MTAQDAGARAPHASIDPAIAVASPAVRALVDPCRTVVIA
jgi:hypothetical protein